MRRVKIGPCLGSIMPDGNLTHVRIVDGEGRVIHDVWVADRARVADEIRYATAKYGETK
jgi:hypothetical protein